LASAESNLAEARTALIKARDDRGRQRAAQAVVTSATAERDALVQKLSAARGIKAQVEGTEIRASGEFAAVAFLGAATGTDQDEVAHLLILVIASLPDILAVLLLVAAGYTQPKAPARKTTRRKAARRARTLKVIPNEQAA
jgi:hypothetical protein